jgi:hypothetical protein
MSCLHTDSELKQGIRTTDQWTREIWDSLAERNETELRLFTADHWLHKGQDSSVGIVISYGLDDWGSIPGMSKFFSLFHSFQTASGFHPASHPMGTVCDFPRIKAVGTWNIPFASILWRRQEWRSYTSQTPKFDSLSTGTNTFNFTG